MAEIPRIVNLGPLAFWVGCISALLFLVSILAGPQDVQGTKLLTFVLFPTWLKLLPFLGSLIMVASGYFMISAEKQALMNAEKLTSSAPTDSKNGGEQVADDKRR